MNKAARGWTVTLAGTGINLGLGVLYTWSVFAAALTDQLHWSKTAASLPYTVACAVFALMMVPAGRLQDRFGPRWAATLGGILVGGGLIIARRSQLRSSIYGLGLRRGDWADGRRPGG